MTIFNAPLKTNIYCLSQSSTGLIMFPSAIPPKVIGNVVYYQV
jgi:hypothetical protein